MSRLYAGSGYADITPAVGGYLYGYNDSTVSTALHDPLEIKALALRGETGEPVVLLSVSVGDFGTECCRETREAISLALGIAPERLLASAIHTHSGPNVCGVSGWGGVDRPYFDGIFKPAAIRAVKEALDSLVPAEFAIAEGESLVGINRRELSEDGEISLGQNPWAPQDKTMTVIRFRHAETKKPIFQMIHYGFHGTAAGNNTEISRDWIGVMIDRAEAETGVRTGFWNGCVGDIGPRLTNGKTVGNIRYAEELGGIAAQDACRIAKPLSRAQYTDAPLTVRTETLSFPCRPLPTREELDAYLASHPADAHYVNIDGMIDAFLRRADELLRSGEEIPKEKKVPVTVVALGDVLAFCPLPYEMFSELCLRLRLHSPFPHTLALSLTNGYEAYLPTKDALARGGYEVECFRYNGPPALADDTDTVVVKEFLGILREMCETV